jgi:putative transcriptional regulator
VRFTTLEALCAVLDCQPGDLLRWEPAAADEPDTDEDLRSVG